MPTEGKLWLSRDAHLAHVFTVRARARAYVRTLPPSPTLDGPVGRSHAGRSCLSIPFFFSWARQFAFISKFHRLPRAPLCPGCAPAAASRHAATHAAEPRTRDSRTPFPHRPGVLCTRPPRLNDTLWYYQRATIGCDAVAHPYGHVGAVRQLQWSCHVSGQGLSP